MEQQEILEGNKLIETFNSGRLPYNNGSVMARLRGSEGYENLYDSIKVSELKYNSSWDWLMPAISKCWDECNQYTATQFDFDSIEIPLKHIDIDGAFKAVVEFLKWYNQQTKQP